MIWHSCYQITFEPKKVYPNSQLTLYPRIYIGRTKDVQKRLSDHFKHNAKYCKIPKLVEMYHYCKGNYTFQILKVGRSDAIKRFEKRKIEELWEQRKGADYILLNQFAGGRRLATDGVMQRKVGANGQKIYSKRKRRNIEPKLGRSYRCSRCKEKKDGSEFYKDRSRWNGLHSRCKACARECHRISQEKIKAFNEQRPSVQMDLRCNFSNEILPASEFHNNKYAAFGKRLTCQRISNQVHQINQRIQYFKKKVLKEPKHLQLLQGTFWRNRSKLKTFCQSIQEGKRLTDEELLKLGKYYKHYYLVIVNRNLPKHQRRWYCAGFQSLRPEKDFELKTAKREVHHNVLVKSYCLEYRRQMNLEIRNLVDRNGKENKNYVVHQLRQQLLKTPYAYCHGFQEILYKKDFGKCTSRYDGIAKICKEYRRQRDFKKYLLYKQYYYWAGNKIRANLQGVRKGYGAIDLPRNLPAKYEVYLQRIKAAV